MMTKQMLVKRMARVRSFANLGKSQHGWKISCCSIFLYFTYHVLHDEQILGINLYQFQNESILRNKICITSKYFNLLLMRK